MNKNDLRYIKTEELIQKAFFQCVEKSGFEQVTVSGLCDSARISRHTFYTHYEDKYHLRKSILESFERVLEESIDSELISRASKGDFLASSQRYIEDMSQNSTIVKILLQCAYQDVTKLIARFYVDIPTAMYVKDYDEKIQKPEACIAKAYLVGALISFIEEWFALKEEISKEQLIIQLYKMCEVPAIHFIELLTG